MSAPARVVVAMSGGVDSSVAAALLVEAGCEVIGVTMNLAGAASRCCSLEDADDARAVAARLGIPFYVANLRERFDREVQQAFADAYLAGRTPIPCVTCNSRFKFDALLARARAFGAQALASGHYARIDGGSGEPYRLRRARDRSKDQSYFLFELRQEQLAALRFPLGELDKPAVRAHARRLGLVTAEKAESQEICFVPDGDYAAAVERIRPQRVPGPGEIRDGAGRVLGTHPGIHHFTVGQRRGLGVAIGERLYVTRIDAANNRVEVGGGEALLARAARLVGVNWIAGAPPQGGAVEASVRIRYRHAGAAARIETSGGETRVHFAEPIAALTPGQAAVFDRGDEVLGGGWIEEVLR